MLEDQYYLFTAFSILVFIFTVLFLMIEIPKYDKVRKIRYDGSVFIVTPLALINIMLMVILAYESWNLEIYDPSIGDYVVKEMEYLVFFWVGFLFMNTAIWIWKTIEFVRDLSLNMEKG